MTGTPNTVPSREAVDLKKVKLNLQSAVDWDDSGYAGIRPVAEIGLTLLAEVERLTAANSAHLAAGQDYHAAIMKIHELKTTVAQQTKQISGLIEANTAVTNISTMQAEEIVGLRDALAQVEAWSRAYPLAVFPEPDWKRTAAVLKDAGMTLDCISASNMRHVITRVQEIVLSAIASHAKQTP